LRIFLVWDFLWTGLSEGQKRCWGTHLGPSISLITLNFQFVSKQKEYKYMILVAHQVSGAA
jgi:hypothetical protein